MIFLDTSYLVALAMENDQNHQNAISVAKNIEKGEFGGALISDYVFDETITLLLGLNKSIQKTTKIGEDLKKTSRMINVGELIFDISWDTFKAQRSTRFSFTDCTTINILNANGIKTIATFDKEFRTLSGVMIVDS